MANDDRKLSYSERDRMRREGTGARPPSRRQRVEHEKRSRDALAVADSLFTDEQGGQAGKALADAVRAAHGSAELATECRAYLEQIGPPAETELVSIFLDAGDKQLSLCALDVLLQRTGAGGLNLEAGLMRQVRIFSEDFDDDLASRAEEILESVS
ncbi:MAG: hypothetical protein VCB25_03100 [Myxococcota bacterium]